MSKPSPKPDPVHKGRSTATDQPQTSESDEGTRVKAHIRTVLNCLTERLNK